MIVGDVPNDWSGPREWVAPKVYVYDGGAALGGRRPLGWRGFLGVTLAIVVLIVLLPIITIMICWAVLAGIGERLSPPGTILGKSPEQLADFAAFLSGPERADNLREEWHTHLAGDRRVRVATGLLISVIRYRLQDLADLLGQPVDALLRSRELSGLVVLVPTLWVSVLFIQQGGLYGLADHLEAVAVVWGAAVGLIHLGRKWRDVRPPERKPRRKNE